RKTAKPKFHLYLEDLGVMIRHDNSPMSGSQSYSPDAVRLTRLAGSAGAE
ncbi:hypothetical protein AVDCRST_MAG94-4214, partial [uncultured Leptolyngbya sp.]